MKSPVLAVLCASLFAVHSSRAAGAPHGSARITVTKEAGTEQCLGQAALQHAVEQRLRRRAFRRDLPVTLEVQIDFGHGAAGWSAELTVRDASARFLGRRSIVTEASHCSALDDSLALVVALLVDSPPSAPETGAEAPPGPADSAVAPNAAVENTLPPAATPARPLVSIKPETPQVSTTLSLPRDTVAPREPWHFDVSFGASAAVGIVPGLAMGGELGIAARAPHLPEIRLFGDWFGRRDQQRAGSNAGAHFDFADVGLELCALDVRLSALRWFGCAGQAIGRLRVASYGFDQNATSEHLTYALSARTGLRFPLTGRLNGRLGARAELPFAREVFEYGSRDGRERGLFEMKPVTAVLDLGLIVQL